MNETRIHSKTARFAGQVILYDPQRVSRPLPEMFSRAYWETRKAIFGQASDGRCPALYVRHQQWEFVLRSFQRGGAMQLLKNRYFWFGAANSRAWREWMLLSMLKNQGFSVPRPVAALASRDKVLYTAALLTERIPGTRPLSEMLSNNHLDPTTWKHLGSFLLGFHQAGVYHADLNAHNILIDDQASLWLIDFDKGRIREPRKSWQRTTLNRLKRSLDKICLQRHGRPFSTRRWSEILDGYHSETRKKY